MSLSPSPVLADFAGLQESIAAELRTKAAFAALPEAIRVGDPKVLEADLDNTIQQLGGLLLLVEPPRGTNDKPAVFSRLHFGDVRIAVTCAEEPLLNRAESGTGLTALRACLEVCRALHGYRPAGADVMLQCLSWEPVEDPSLVAYRANFRTALTLSLTADLSEL